MLVCRRSWNGRTYSSIPASLSAAWNAILNVLGHVAGTNRSEPVAPEVPYQAPLRRAVLGTVLAFQPRRVSPSENQVVAYVPNVSGARRVGGRGDSDWRRRGVLSRERPFVCGLHQMRSLTTKHVGPVRTPP